MATENLNPINAVPATVDRLDNLVKGTHHGSYFSSEQNNFIEHAKMGWATPRDARHLLRSKIKLEKSNIAKEYKELKKMKDDREERDAIQNEIFDHRMELHEARITLTVLNARLIAPESAREDAAYNLASIALLDRSDDRHRVQESANKLFRL